MEEGRRAPRDPAEVRAMPVPELRALCKELGIGKVETFLSKEDFVDAISPFTGLAELMTEARFAANLAGCGPGPGIKVVFLDVDGVLNGTGHFRPDGTLDPACVARMASLVDRTQAKIVLSTSWRLLPKLCVELGSHLVGGGIDPSLIVGATPDRSGKRPRSDEIVEWIAEHRDVVLSWVVLDDIFMDPVKTPDIAGHAVHTQGEVGLQDADVAQAAKILAGELSAAAEPVEQAVMVGSWG